MKRVFCALTVATSLLCGNARAEDTVVPRIERHSCDSGRLSLELLSGGAQCGELWVAENRSRPRDRTIALEVIVLPATDAAAASRQPPVFFITGGPGEAVTDSAVGLASLFLQERKSRDLVFVDMRGTSRPHRLDCLPVVARPTLQAEMFFVPNSETAMKCLKNLRKRADLSQYTTESAVQDLEEARALLGYDRISLLAGSYGTRAAEDYVRLHGSQVELAVLFGVRAPDDYVPQRFGTKFEDAWGNLVRECNEDSACRERFPGLDGDLRAILDNARTHGLSATVRDPETGSVQQVTAGHADIVAGIWWYMYKSSSSRELPLLVSEAARGHPEILLGRIVALLKPLHRQLAYGLYFSVICTEDVAFIDIARETRLAESTMAGADRIKEQAQVCAHWPKGSRSEAFREPLRADVPVLLISGSTDYVTPVAQADRVARTLSHSLHLVFAHRGHTDLDSEAAACLSPILEMIFRTSSLDKVDISCGARLSPSRFVLDETGLAKGV